MFAGLANAVTKHSKVFIAIWIVIVICSVPFMLKADSVLEYELTNMTGSDSESAKGNTLMEENFSNAIGMDEVLAVKYHAGDEGSVITLATEINSLLKTRYGETSGTANLSMTNVGSYSKDSDPVMLFSFKALDEKFNYSTETGNIRDVVAQAKTNTGIGLTTYVTGNAALTYDTMESASGDISKIDPLSVIIIFVLLALFFGALATAVVPPVGFGVAYAVAMLALYLFGSMTGVFYLTSTLMMVTMLGAGCDYGIFIITRYREELKKGADHHEALKTAVEWAGESVFTSGMSVIIGFACLAICDFSLVRNMGIMLAIGIVLALVSALTFVPALVNLIGEKVFWPNTISKYKGVDDGTNNGAYAKVSRLFAGYFRWVARVTRRFAVPIVLVTAIVSVPTVYIYATSESSYDMISVEPDGEAKEGLYAIMDETYGGTLMPTYAVIEFPESAYSNIGAISLNGTTIPYVIWSASGQTYVSKTMEITKDIQDRNGIVASASGLNSWAMLYGQAHSTLQPLVQGSVYCSIYLDAAKAADPTYGPKFNAAYEQAYPTVLETVKATYPGLSDELYGTLAQATTTSKAIEIANTMVDPATCITAKGVADTAIATPTAQETVEKNTVDLSDKYLVCMMPSAVKEHVSALVTAATAYASAHGQLATPELVLGADTTSGTPVYVNMGNLIDGILNVGTGLLSDDGRYVSIMIITTEKPMSDNTMAFVADLQKAFHGENGYDRTYDAVIVNSYVCGTNAVMHDISGTVSAQFNIIQIVVIILLLILLFFILGCYLTPVRAMVCIMLSVIWTLALTFVVFQDILSIPVCWIVPIVLFVVLLGLGMDYDIFITTRIRENKIRGMSNDDAIDAAICSASGTISLCALIMGGTFLCLLVGSSSMLQEFGFALGVGILIDGLFMVTFVGPAVMHLMGDWSWKGPRFLQRKHSE
ncbi:MAG: MMPL family transporter [archaeon]|nr:MMPL family transporter [archaeon]